LCGSTIFGDLILNTVIGLAKLTLLIVAPGAA